MSKVFKIIGGLCVVAACAAGGLWGTSVLLADDGQGDQAEEGAPAIRVGVVTPQMQQIEATVSTVGTLRPIRAIEVVPDAPGRVTAVPVTSGQSVAEGDLLVQLDDLEAQAALSEAEATQREARQEFERIETLADRNTAAEAQLEEARAAARRADAAAMAARAALDDLAITAPFAGTLGLIDIEPGAYLDGATPVTTLSDLSVVEVAATLPERYFDQITPGLSVDVTTPAYPETDFIGTVTLRDTQIDLETRSFAVRAEIDNADGRLVGGMFANASLVLDTYDGLTVPDDAIISEGVAAYVYTVADGTASRTDVTLGTSVGAMTEVRDGLDADAQVVAAGWDDLTDGATVEIADDFAREGLE